MAKLFFLIFIFGMVGCAEQQYLADDPLTVEVLPKGATNIKNAGNNWITFQWNNAGVEKCFLYHKEIEGINQYRVGFEAIVPIDCK